MSLSKVYKQTNKQPNGNKKILTKKKKKKFRFKVKTYLSYEGFLSPLNIFYNKRHSNNVSPSLSLPPPQKNTLIPKVFSKSFHSTFLYLSGPHFYPNAVHPYPHSHNHHPSAFRPFILSYVSLTPQ